MNHNRVLLYKLIPSGPFSHTFLRAHHSAWTLEETGPVLTCWQTHIKSKDLLTLKTFVCILRPFYYCWRGWESAPSAMLLHTLIDHNLFFQFTSPGIGFKNRLSHLMPAKAREAKDVRFKFKGWLQGKQAAPPHLSLQVSFLSRDSSLLWLLITLEIPIFFIHAVEKQSGFSCSQKVICLYIKPSFKHKYY